MRIIENIYINGAFVQPHGQALFDLHNPATAEVFGQVRLGDSQDAADAIAAAKRAFSAMSRTSKAERLDMLKALQTAMLGGVAELHEAIQEEYGAPIGRSSWMAD